jgi:hypothetical protein
MWKPTAVFSGTLGWGPRAFTSQVCTELYYTRRLDCDGINGKFAFVKTYIYQKGGSSVIFWLKRLKEFCIVCHYVLNNWQVSCVNEVERFFFCVKYHIIWQTFCNYSLKVTVPCSPLPRSDFSHLYLIYWFLFASLWADYINKHGNKHARLTSIELFHTFSLIFDSSF